MTRTENDEFLRIARERFQYAMKCDQKDREEGQEDEKFQAGDQWREAARKQREETHRPVLTWNRLPTFVAQVSNSGRENKPAIMTTPMDGATQETAEVLAGYIRHVEYESDADIAYDTAREHQLISGRGYVRIRTEYQPESFEQSILIDPIENQWSVLLDPSARRYDRQDGDFAFVSTRMSKDAYRRKFGQTYAAKQSFFANELNPAGDWIGIGNDGEEVQVAEYWLREHQQRQYVRLTDGSTGYLDDMADVDESHIVERRMADCCTVKQYIIDGVEILDETEWLGSTIPIVPVWGREMVVDGFTKHFSLIRFAKDPQRLVNLYVSNIAEQIAQMPKNPYIGAAGQFEGFEDDWASLATDPRPFLQYNVTDRNGNPVGAPSRQNMEPPIQALTIGLNQAIDAIKASMGIFDAALGADSAETSGIAIQRRRNESDVANFHYPDNEARSRKSIGKIILELIRAIKSDAATLPTRAKDGTVEIVDLKAHKHESGKVIHHDLTAGNYDVAISTGPSYLSQRQAANDMYMQIAKTDKNFMTYAGDLLFRTSDSPGADSIADRYEKMLPAALKPQDPDQAQQGQQLQAQVKQLQDELQKTHQFASQLHDQLQSKQVEAASRENIARMQAEIDLQKVRMQEETKRAIAFAQLNMRQGLEMLQQETAAISDRTQMIAQAHQQQAAQAHAAQMQAAQHQQQAALQIDQQEQAQRAQQMAAAQQAGPAETPAPQGSGDW